MNRRRVLLLGLVAVIAAVLFVVWRGRGGGGKARGAAGGAQVAGGSSGARGTAHAGGPHALPDPRKQQRASIAGTISVENGGALAGATVCTSWYADGAVSDDNREPICVTSDAAGRYLLADQVPGWHRVSAFAPRHGPAGYRDAARRRNGLELRAGEQRTGIDIVLKGGAVEVSGVVEDVSGGPIADALVQARDQGNWWTGSGGRALTRSDAQGKFSLWLPPGEVYVWALAEGYAENGAEAIAPSAKVEVLLTPESTLSGIVVEHGAGTPVEGAIVSIGGWRGGVDDGGGFGGGGASTARTDEQGRFRIARLRPGRYKPNASASGRYGEAAQSVLLGLGQSADGVRIEVHTAATVRGQVVIDEGNGKTRPCADGWVGLEEEAAGRWTGDSTEDDGTVEIHAVLPGRYDVNVRCENLLSRDKYDPIEVKTADVEGLVWTVGPGATIRGVVKNSEGTPVASAHVQASSTGGPARSQRSWGGDDTDKDGSFILKGLVGGDYTLEVTASGERDAEPKTKVTVPAGGETTVEITLPGSGTIAGSVVDSEGKPVPNARVRVANNGWRWNDDGRTADDGTFTIEGVEPGDRRVVATRGWWDEMRKPGSKDDDVQGERVQVVAGKTASVRLVVESRSGVIHGTVRDERGEPVVDAWVISSRESEAAGALAGGAARETRWQWRSDERPVITSTDGSFTLRELAPGTYAVRAFRRGGGEAVVEHVKLGSTVTVVIKSTGSIAGRIVVPDGVPPDEFHISIADEAAGFNRREKFFRTGGVFAMNDLPAGNFLVTADSTAGRVMTRITLTAGEHKAGVELTLERKVTVRGRMVELGTTNPVPGLRASVMPIKGGRSMGWGSGADKEYISGEDGRFEVKNAATGRVWITAWPEDWENSTWSWSRAFKVIDGTKDVVDVGDIEVVKKRKERDEDPSGDLGFTTKEQSPETEPEDLKMEVAHIRPGGPAARSGLEVGDVIVSVDGTDVQGVNASRGWVLMDVPEGAKLTLGVARGASVQITAGPPL